MKTSILHGFAYASFIVLSPAVLATKSLATATLDHPKALIAKAVSQFTATPLNEWSFQVDRYENEEGHETSSVELFTPHHIASEQWQLLKINDRLPSRQEQQDFQQQKHHEKSNISLPLNQLIQTDSLTILAEDPAFIRASFAVHIEKLGADASKHLTGTLKFAKQGEFIEQIEITNTASFSPFFAAKIDQLSLSMAFIKIDQAILTQRIDLNMQGRFAWVTEIEETSSDVYSNYRYLGHCKTNC